VIMVSTIKISSLCCNYADGHKKPEHVTNSAQAYVIKKWPSLLEYFSYLCYFPTFLAGPAFHYKAYLSYIDGSMYAEGSPSFASQLFASLKVFVISIICVAVHKILGAQFPFDPFFTENGLAEYSLIWKFVYLHFALMAKRCQYYFVWKLSEGSAILAGMGFNGWETHKDLSKSPKFNGCNNIDIWKCEFPQNVRDYTMYWNMKTAEWLRIYVYERQQDLESKKTSSNAMMVTNIVSAFWHGFYPGYYFAFGYASFIIDEMRIIRNTIRPKFMLRSASVVNGVKVTELGNYPLKYLYDILGVLFTWLTFDSGMGCFTALSFSNCFTFLNQIYYSPVIGYLVTYPILKYILSEPKKHAS